jgi:hypothetical protein
MFASKDRAYLSGAPYSDPVRRLIGLMDLYANNKLAGKKCAPDKHSSLYGLTVSDEEKIFCKIDTWISLFSAEKKRFKS